MVSDMARILKFADEECKPDVERAVWDGGPFTVVRYRYQPGACFPSHHHDNAQITIVLSGRIRFHIEGEEFALGPGEAIYIPAGVPHFAEVDQASEPVLSLNVFHPPRKEHP